MSGLDRPIRVMLIGRHFWPHGSIDSAGHLMDLATGLHTAGAHVSVVTPKHSTSSSERFTFREFDVHRPIRMFRTGWTARGDRSSSRYIRNLREWIQSNSNSCDVIFCDGAREECIATVDAARSLSVPSVVRFAGDGQSSDFDFLATNRSGKRCRSAAKNADAVVISDAIDQRRWLADGGDSNRAVRIPVGIGPSPTESLSSQNRLRLAMARINGDLHVPDACTVIMSVERLHDDSGVMTLVDSAYALSEKIHGLQFWLIGDGNARETIFSRLKSDGLRQSVAMPGSFGLMDDVFGAADVLIHTGDEGFQHQIPNAIAAAIPIVMANTKTAREFFSVWPQEVSDLIIDSKRDTSDAPHGTDTEPGKLIGWFDPARPKTLRFAIQRIVENIESARERARQLRRELQNSRSRSKTIQQYMRLFRRLAIANQAATTHPNPEDSQ